MFDMIARMKGFSVATSFVLLLLAACSNSSYQIQQLASSSSSDMSGQSSVSSEASTLNGRKNSRSTAWETYVNEESGFEMKYPTGVEIQKETINRGQKIVVKIDSVRTLLVEVLRQNPQCPDTAAAGDLPGKMIGGVEFMGVTGHQVGDEIKDNSYPPYVDADDYCAVINGIEYKIIPAIFHQNTGEGNFAETDPTLNQIISTFRFTSRGLTK